MVTTNDPELAKKMQIYALHGLSADAWSRFSDDGYRHYDVTYPGFKYNLTDMAASLGLAQLPKLESWLRRREEIWARYDDAFSDLPVSRPKPPEPDTIHARHLYTLLVLDHAPISRDGFLSGMHRRGVGTGVHYRALHTQTYYRERCGYRSDQFPNAAYIGERTVSIPLSPKLTDDEVSRVIDAERATLRPTH
jgi:dTDP-4-amino-4,6-dideoxygalactose transaminase